MPVRWRATQKFVQLFRHNGSRLGGIRKGCQGFTCTTLLGRLAEICLSPPRLTGFKKSNIKASRPVVAEVSGRLMWRCLAMSLIEMLEGQTKVLRASDVARIFDVTPQHIYKMAASGKIPSFRVSGAIRFDPQALANWLRKEPSAYATSGRQALGCTA